MIRIIYTICDIVAGICAVVSPVAIVHWLVKSTGIKAMAPLVALLDPVFVPLTHFLEFFIKTPVIKYQAQTIPTTQGLLAILLTIAFFVLHFISETLKATEQKVEVTTQVYQHKRRLQQLKAEQQKMISKQVQEAKRIYTQVNYDFTSNPAAGAYFENTYLKYGGKAVELHQRGMSLEFTSLEQAFKFSLEATQAIMSYYATLRPVDPQPPFQVGIHAAEANRPAAESLNRARLLTRYAASNQIVFSQEAKSLLDAQGISLKYQFQSIGVYAFEGGRNQEVFRLLYQKRDKVY